MSYLYVLCNDLLEQMLLVTKQKDDLFNKQFNLVKFIIHNKTNYYYNTIISNAETYYSFLNKVINDKILFDTDFICDCLLDCQYEEFHFLKDYGNYLERKNINANEKMKLFNVISKIVIISEIFKIFVYIIRKNYISDFFNKVSDKDEINSLIIFLLKNINYNQIKIKYIKKEGFNKRDNKVKMMDLIDETILLKQDYISEVIDSNDTSLLIIEEQQYYIYELNRLINKINEIGNVTKFDDVKFDIFVDFLYSFKENALNKIDCVNKNNKCKKYNCYSK